MHHTQILRLLISVDALLTALGILAEPFVPDDVPPQLRAAFADAYPDDNIAVAFLMLALLIMVVAGYFGMWRFKHWGRLAYTTACVVDIVFLALYKPMIMSGPLLALTVATGLSGGALLATAWLSDVRREFK